jgi:hypothetical protein
MGLFARKDRTIKSSTPASSTPASSTPASSTPASSTPASSTPASSTPASSHTEAITKIQQPTATETSVVSATATPEPFDIASVGNAELPKKVTLLTDQIFSIADGAGHATGRSGAPVDLISKSGEVLEVAYLGARKKIPYKETSFASDIQSARNRKAEAQRKLNEEAEKIRLQREADDAARAAQEAASLKAEAGETPINSKWDGSVQEVKSYLQKNLKDPKSTEYISWSPVTSMDFEGAKAWAVRVKYRSKNSFGGYVVEDGVAFIRHGKVVAYRPLQ